MPLLKAYSLVIDKYLREPTGPWDLKEPAPWGIRRQDLNGEHYFCFQIYTFPPLLQKNHCLGSGLSAFYLLGLGESDDIQKGRKLTHRRFERITRVSKYQLSSPPVLFCKLGFKYINGRAPHRLPAQDGSMNLAATAWSLISMTTLALPFDNALSCGKEQKRKKSSQPHRHMGGSWLILPTPHPPTPRLSVASIRATWDSVLSLPQKTLGNVWGGGGRKRVNTKQMC